MPNGFEAKGSISLCTKTKHGYTNQFSESRSQKFTVIKHKMMKHLHVYLYYHRKWHLIYTITTPIDNTNENLLQKSDLIWCCRQNKTSFWSFYFKGPKISERNSRLIKHPSNVQRLDDIEMICVLKYLPQCVEKV